MDRLIIETTLADVNDIYLSEERGTRPNPAIIFGFKAAHTDQVIHAFTALKDVAARHPLELVICKTVNSGIYDIELKTEGLDEPVRIMNKAISHEMLGAIEDQIVQNRPLVVGTNVSPSENWLEIHTTYIRECAIKY